MRPPWFLDIDRAMRLHQSLIAAYGGGVGVRDIGLLQSALANPVEPPLPRRWCSCVNKAERAAEVTAWLHCVQRRHPFGDDRYVRLSTVRLSLKSTTKPRGRPRQETCPRFASRQWPGFEEAQRPPPRWELLRASESGRGRNSVNFGVDPNVERFASLADSRRVRSIRRIPRPSSQFPPPSLLFLHFGRKVPPTSSNPGFIATSGRNATNRVATDGCRPEQHGGGRPANLHCPAARWFVAQTAFAVQLGPDSEGARQRGWWVSPGFSHTYTSVRFSVAKNGGSTGGWPRFFETMFPRAS